MNEENKKDLPADVGEAVNKEAASEGGKINVNNTLLAVVAVLVIMSAVQVFQLQGLTAAISSGAIKASAQTSGGSAALLPSQVGGCG